MKNCAEVVIIGGGVVGLSIAYHLGEMGYGDVVVLEKDHIGFGSTGKCAGGIRQQFSTELNIKLSMESVKFFENFEKITGISADFHQNGYLLLAINENEFNCLRKNLELQHKLGLKVYLLSSKEIKEIIPHLAIEDVFGATYCPTDGFADPSSVIQGFASCARRYGVKIYEETKAVGIEFIQEGRIKKIHTTRGDIETPKLVNAAGPYAGEVGNMMGLYIPVHPLRRHIFFTEPYDMAESKFPMVIDFHTGFWFRKEGSGFIFGMRNPKEKEGFDTSVDWDFLTDTLAYVAIQRFPPFADLGIQNAWAGLHADTPDFQAILGEVPGMEGVYLACGFSGHGFMHSPAVGKVMAQLISEKEPFIDVSSLSIDRFKKNSSKSQREKIFI